MTQLGNSIKTLRKQSHMTQDDLAAKLNVTRQTVSNYENGRSEPDIEMLVHIAEVFKTDVNSLVNMETAHHEAEAPKHWGKAVWLVVLTIAVFILLNHMTEWANTYGAQHYNLSFLFAAVGFFCPIVLALLGYTVIYTLRQYARFPDPKPAFKHIHRLLWAFLIISCAMYLPQVLWCCGELLRLAGLLHVEGKLPVCNILPAHHFYFVAMHSEIWYTVCTLCGAGIAITETKTPKD